MAEYKYVPEFNGNLRKYMLKVPEVIRKCSGIRIFGKRIKSIVFSTDIAIIRNINADAVIAVYPFTPQPIITQAMLLAADIPVFCGVGGGTTTGLRVVGLARDAEHQGAIGVVLNAPTKNSVLRQVSRVVDIPVVVTVVSADDGIDARIRSGANILNVSAAAHTPELVRQIRKEYPHQAIIATGGPSDDTILATIEAGANAITWTPPTNGELFRGMMEDYRAHQPHHH